jgi:F0F1-type ATP synthase epsilon subunit
MKVEIVSPERTTVLENVRAITFPSIDGEMEVLDGHAPGIVVLKSGKINIVMDDPMNILIFESGYAHVMKDRTTLLLEHF